MTITSEREGFAEAWNEGVSVTKLRERYNVGKGTITKWVKELNLTPRRVAAAVPVPDDWAEIAPKHNIAQLRHYYHVSDTVIHRWIRESGVKPLRGPNRGGIGRVSIERARTEIELAANHLRKTFRNVHRADLVVSEPPKKITWGDQRGLDDGGAGHYYVDGVGVLANSEMLELAAKHGWGLS